MDPPSHTGLFAKLVLFGTTHICAIDGFSDKVVAFCSMPVKNNCAIYAYVYMCILVVCEQYS